MSLFGYIRGHRVYNVNYDWFYANTNELVIRDSERPCFLCHMPCRINEPDPCLGYLDDVAFACCGHGRIKMPGDPYVKFNNGTVIRGHEALAYFEKIGKRVGNLNEELKM